MTWPLRDANESKGISHVGGKKGGGSMANATENGSQSHGDVLPGGVMKKRGGRWSRNAFALA